VVLCSGSALVSINKVNPVSTEIGYRVWVQSVCNHPPRPTQPSIPLGSVNEYHLRQGRQMQVWFILLADERGVCR